MGLRSFISKRLKTSGGDVDRVILLLWLMIVVGMFSLLIPASIKLTVQDWAGALTVVAAGLFLAGASTVTGSAVGFLFGVPRKGENGRDQAEESTDRPELYRPNTNLEQISDWLTKIIVGVGLTQIPAVLDYLNLLGEYAGPAMGETPLGKIVAIAIIVHYLIVGFFQGFLLAYLWLPGAFVRAVSVSQFDKESGNVD